MVDLADRDGERSEDQGDGVAQSGQAEEGEAGGLELPDGRFDQDYEGQLEAGSEEGHEETHQEDDTAPASLWVILPEHNGALDGPLEDPGSPSFLPTFVFLQSCLHLRQWSLVR